MASWVSTSLPWKQLPYLAPSVVVGASTLCPCSCSKSCYVIPFSSRWVRRRKLKVSVNMVDSRRKAVQSQVGSWEEPDNGSESDSESEYEEEDKEDKVEEENDLDFESDWEEKGDTQSALVEEQQATFNYEDELAKEVEQLLEPGEMSILQQNPAPNVQKISTAKWSPLHTLALSGQIHFLDQLLQSGVDIDFPDKDGLTALHVSVIGKKEAVISHLLRKGASPHVKDKDGVTPLHYAAQVGALQTVKLLIKYHVDLNCTDNEGWTPLHVAVQTKSRDIAKVLLVNGADKSRKNQAAAKRQAYKVMLKQ